MLRFGGGGGGETNAKVVWGLAMAVVCHVSMWGVNEYFPKSGTSGELAAVTAYPCLLHDSSPGPEQVHSRYLRLFQLNAAKECQVSGARGLRLVCVRE